MPLPVTDTRSRFGPLCRDIVALLRTLQPGDWERPTMAGRWRVRDIVAHMCDTALRRLSLHRDRRMPSSGPRGTTERDLTLFINELNATWVRVAERFSPRVLTELYAHASEDLVAFIETLDPLADAVLPVSWAGGSASPQWLDIGREFTEIWHHGSQVRAAVGAGPFRDASWLRDVLQLSMHALPHAYRAVRPPHDDMRVVIEITGRAPGTWTLRRVGDAWDIDEGGLSTPAATIAMSDEMAWRLFFNALSPNEAQAAIAFGGNLDLARPILDARAVIV
ncbi:MAG TPA: maleylpyruvate isomerase N-terminal domain-containing protein [Vicinamibacterales bacterium]|nr:maleylpyruvate isomerase N-terminal domain-containing protein [Vicinamibacterales bacterium]